MSGKEDPFRNGALCFFCSSEKGKESMGGRRGRRSLYSNEGGILEDRSQMPMLEGLPNPPITLQLLLQTTLVVDSDAILLLHFVTVLGEGVTGYDEGIHRCWIHG